jgi:K+-transporting ATPase KdpF subunit
MYSAADKYSNLYAVHAIYLAVAQDNGPFNREGRIDVRHGLPGGGDRVFRRRHGLRLDLRLALAGLAMIFDYVLGALVTAVIFAYLVYALVRPEKF